MDYPKDIFSYIPSKGRCKILFLGLPGSGTSSVVDLLLSCRNEVHYPFRRSRFGGVSFNTGGSLLSQEFVVSKHVRLVDGGSRSFILDFQGEINRFKRIIGGEKDQIFLEENKGINDEEKEEEGEEKEEEDLWPVHAVVFVVYASIFLNSGAVERFIPFIQIARIFRVSVSIVVTKVDEISQTLDDVSLRFSDDSDPEQARKEFIQGERWKRIEECIRSKISSSNNNQKQNNEEKFDKIIPIIPVINYLEKDTTPINSVCHFAEEFVSTLIKRIELFQPELEIRFDDLEVERMDFVQNELLAQLRERRNVVPKLRIEIYLSSEVLEIFKSYLLDSILI